MKNDETAISCRVKDMAVLRLNNVVPNTNHS